MGQNMLEFVPEGWKIFKSAGGDLNNDKAKDYAIILQSRDSIWFKEKSDNNNDSVLAPARILAIILYDPECRQYKLAGYSNSFIISVLNPEEGDPFDTIIISQGFLMIGFHSNYHQGKGFKANYLYKFRYQNRQFYLTAADYVKYNRVNAETETRNYYFTNKNVRITTKSSNAEDKPRVEWENYKLKKLQTLRTFIRPFTWRVSEDVLL
ncbi:MAG: hypothetical protein NTW49_10485 [Bacteroidia bacterium]|nr:hypothetical protein [Bacteroidia bacterium]